MKRRNFVTITLASLGLTSVHAQTNNQKPEPKKMLIVYFSKNGLNYWHGGTKNLKRGNTARMADQIQKLTGADVYEIVPTAPYPFEYRATVTQAVEEKRADQRPQIKNPIPDSSQYELIFLGHPIWDGHMPMIVRSFLDKANLSGKKIAHFCTHEGSGLGSSDRDLKKRIKDAEFLPPLAVAGTQVDDSTAEIENWVKKVTK